MQSPIETLNHAADYLRRTRGVEAYERSAAHWIIRRALISLQNGCLKELIGRKAQSMGILCPCILCQIEREGDAFELKPENLSLLPSGDAAPAGSAQMRGRSAGNAAPPDYKMRQANDRE